MARPRELREQRLIPEGRDLHGLQRYEAALEGGPYEALHGIERVWVHRACTEPVPVL